MASDTVFFEKLAEAVRLYPCLYNKSSEDFKNANKKKPCWKDVTAAVGVISGKWTFYSFVMAAQEHKLFTINITLEGIEKIKTEKNDNKTL